MKYIITERQYRKLINEYEYVNPPSVTRIRENSFEILKDLIEDEEFYDVLRDHSYNKYKSDYWWKNSMERMMELAPKKYCHLFKKIKKIKKKYFLDLKVRSDYFRETECETFFNILLSEHFSNLRSGKHYVGDNHPLEFKSEEAKQYGYSWGMYFASPAWVSEYFMELFGK